MSPEGQITIIDPDGTRGVVEHYQPGDTEMTVRFEDRRYVLPTDIVVVRDDGSYHLSTRVSELDRLETDHDEAVVIPVVAEELNLNKRQVDKAKVRVTKVVEEREETVEEPLMEERVEIERVPINQPINGPAEVRYEGDTMIVPLVREVLVVQKQLMVTEEVRITKKRLSVQDRRHVTLRHEDVKVERIDVDAAETQA